MSTHRENEGRVVQRAVVWLTRARIVALALIALAALGLAYLRFSGLLT
jgi:hypothetical protein